MKYFFKYCTSATIAALLLAACSPTPPSTASSEPRGEAAMPVNAELCSHDAPAAECFICHPELRDKGRLWCKEHARYEDRCWLCHPELEDKDRLYCKEHALYEDECYFCHPELKETGQAHPEDKEEALLMCKEHNLAEEECGICHPDLAVQMQPGQSMKVRLPAAGSASMNGASTGPPEPGGLSQGIECLAEIGFNQNKLAQVSAPVGGIIQSVDADLGENVTEQQVVAKIWSATIAEAVAKAVLTHQTLERERKLRANRVTSERDLQQAEAEHRSACQQARTFGFSEEQIDAFGANPDEPVMLEVRVPFAGEIVDRFAVRGALIEPGKPLFTVADRSSMWAMLKLPEAALGQIHPGQTVELRLESLPGQTFTGRLTWVSAKVDDRTRMTAARVEVPNPKGILRANMFARARVITQPAAASFSVPEAAVQRVEGQPLVFIKLAEDLFEARAVRLGARREGRIEVLEGLAPGESVLFSPTFPLKSQLLISRLGAGCAHE